MRTTKIFVNITVSFIVLACLMSFKIADSKKYPYKLNETRLAEAEVFKIEGDYISALDVYRKLLGTVGSGKLTPDQDTTLNSLIFEMAECYRLCGLYNRAEPLYRRLIRRNFSDPLVFLFYGNCLRNRGKIDEAIIAYTQYKEYEPQDYRWKYGVRTCHIIKDLFESPVSYEIKKNNALSGRGDDFRPFIDQKNNLLYIAQSKKLIPDVVKVGLNRLFVDIYKYQKVRGRWVGRRKIESLSTPGHDEFSVSLSNDSNELFFTRCFIKDSKNIGCSIFQTVKNNNTWGDAKNIDVFKGNSIKEPFLSNDGTELYFESKMAGGVGGSDIWVVNRDENSIWGQPVCLDSLINTEGDERSPVISPEGNLFFSSNLRLGMGCFDIFKAEKDESSWNVKNIGYPLNSVENDVAISFTRGESEGFIVSDRNTSLSNYEIFAFTSIKPSVKGVVKDLYSNDLLNKVDIELIQDDTPVNLFVTGKLGFYYFDLQIDSDYIVRLSKAGYLKTLVSINKAYSQVNTSINKDLKMLRKGVSNILYDIYFNDGELDLSRSRKGLNNLINIFKANPEYQMELKIYTNEFSNDRNILVTKERAKYLQKFLKTYGVSRDQVLVNGYGNVPVIANEMLSKRFDKKVRTGYELSPAYIRLLEPKYRQRAIAATKRIELVVVKEN